MAKQVKSTPFMITIAEKLGTTVGMIVAKTSGAVEGAGRLVEGASKSLKPAPAPRVKPAAKRKLAATKKKAVQKSASKAKSARKRKPPAKKAARRSR